jgi:hypothetical protein
VPTDVEIERVLATVSATLNDQKLDSFDRDCAQEMVAGALGGEQELEADDAGGLHDSEGVRVGAIRRTPSGEWIVERQNPEAHRPDAAIPSPPRERLLRKAFTRLKVFGG